MQFRSVTVMAPKSPFLCGKRSGLSGMVFVPAEKLSGRVWTYNAFY